MGKKYSVTLLAVIFFSCMGIQCGLDIGHAETQIKIISASATSSSNDSLPVADLIDLSKEGFWKPKGQDSCANEGLFFQFLDPVLVNRIEVKVKNGKGRYFVSYYLDGKMNVSQDKSKSAVKYRKELDQKNGVEYWVSYKDSGNDRIIILGTRKPDSFSQGENSIAPLNVKVRSFFLKIDKASPEATVTSVRFFQNNRIPLQIQPPVFKKGTVTATSVLEPETAYNIHRIFDSKLDFAWAMDGKKSNGVGEKFTLDFDQPESLSGCIFWNGYQRSSTHYYANSRLAKVRVAVNGEEKWVLALKDKMGSQVVKFPENVDNVKTLSVTVEGIFPGTAYKDLVLSEFRLIDRSGNVIVFDAPVPEITMANSELQKVLDMTIEPCLLGIVSARQKLEELYSNSFETSYDYPHISLRFRSNGSFVCYNDFGEVMEGSWEPLENGFRIFGKKYRTDYNSSVYLQEIKKNTAVRIFETRVEVIDCEKVSFAQAQKYLKPILADRGFYAALNNKKPPFYWWIGVAPFGQVKLTGANDVELMKKAYDFIIQKKALLISSSVFTNVFLPRDQVVQTYEILP